MLRVECSCCGDIVEFSGDAVGQGFMCLPCSESTESLEVEQFYEDMAPASAPIPEIDATNALISDLEAQNTNLLNEVTSLDNTIVALRKDVETSQMWEDKSYVAVEKYMKEIERLQDELDERKDKDIDLLSDLSYWKGLVDYYLKRALKAEDHPWKNLWAYLWE